MRTAHDTDAGPPARPRSGRSPSPRRRTLLLVVVGLAAAVLAALVTAGPGEDPTAVSYDRTTRMLEFRAETFGGEVVESSALRGTPLVLNFYASWCAVCDRELPDFQRVSQQLGDRVRVLGINPQSNDTDAAQATMIQRAGVTYPTLRDPQDQLLRQFNTTGGLPTTVFVGADGVVQKVHNGLLTEQLLLDQIAASLGVRS